MGEGCPQVYHQGFEKIFGEDDLSHRAVCVMSKVEENNEVGSKNGKPDDVIVTEAGENMDVASPRSPIIAKVGAGNDGISDEARLEASEVNGNTNSRGRVEVERANKAQDMEQQNNRESTDDRDPEIFVKAELNVEGTHVTV